MYCWCPVQPKLNQYLRITRQIFKGLHVENIKRHIKRIVLGRDKSYFAKKPTKTLRMPSGFDRQHIWYVWWSVLPQTDDIHKVINCYLLARLVSLFVWGRPHTCASQEKQQRNFNFTFRYIDDILSLNNSMIGDFVDRIYRIELETKNATDTVRSLSYLDLHIEINSEGRWRQTRWVKFPHCELFFCI